MKKQLTLSVFCILWGFVSVESSVQSISLSNPISGLSFELNNSPLSIAPAIINSIVGALNSGQAVTFTAVVQPGEDRQVYYLTVSSPAWPGNKAYPIVSPITLSNSLSCTLNIPNQKPIAMPISNNETVTVVLRFPFVTPPYDVHLNGNPVISVVLQDTYGVTITLNPSQLQQLNNTATNIFEFGTTQGISTSFFVKYNNISIPAGEELLFPVTFIVNDTLTLQVAGSGFLYLYSKS